MASARDDQLISANEAKVEQNALKEAVAELKRFVEGENTRLIKKNKLFLPNKGIDKRFNAKGEMLPGKRELISLECQELNDLLTLLNEDKSAERVNIHLEEFLHVRIPSVARICHHKRHSIRNQIANKSLFLGGGAAIGFWLGGPIGAAVGFILGSFLNIWPETGKYFYGQAVSQWNWEALAKTKDFSGPTPGVKGVVRAEIHKKMQATFSGWAWESLGYGKKGRSTTAVLAKEYTRHRQRIVTNNTCYHDDEHTAANSSNQSGDFQGAWQRQSNSRHDQSAANAEAPGGPAATMMPRLDLHRPAPINTYTSRGKMRLPSFRNADDVIDDYDKHRNFVKRM